MLDWLRRRRDSSLLERADLARKAGDVERARSLLNGVSKHDARGRAIAEVMLAGIARELGDVSTTLRHRRRAFELAPEEVSIAAVLASELRDSGHEAEALDVWDRAAAQHPPGTEAHEACSREAALTAAAIGAPDALPRLEAAVERHQADYLCLAESARLRQAAGDCSAAAKLWRRVLRLQRDHLDAHQALLELEGGRGARAFAELRDAAERSPAWASIARGRYEEARAGLSSCELPPPWVDWSEARVAIDEQREDDARRHLEQLANGPAPFPSVPYLLAVRYHIQGQFELAEAHCAQVLSADPDDADTMMLRAAIALRTRGREAQRALERRAMRADPTLLTIQGRARHEHIEGRRLTHAQARWKDSPSLKGNDARLARAEASAALDIGEPRWALDLLRHIGDAACLERADAWYAAGELQPAEDDYRAALRTAPDDARLHAGLGTLLVSGRGLLAEGEPHLRRALELDPNDHLAHANLGVMLAERGDLEPAMTHFRRAIRTSPEQGMPYSNLSAALESRGELEAAERYARFATLLMPREPQAAARHAKLLQRLGRADEAERALARAQLILEDSMSTQGLAGTLPPWARSPDSPYTREAWDALRQLADEVFEGEA